MTNTVHFVAPVLSRKEWEEKGFTRLTDATCDIGDCERPAIFIDHRSMLLCAHYVVRRCNDNTNDCIND